MSDTCLPQLRFYSFVLRVGDLAPIQDWYCRVLGFSVRTSGRASDIGTSFVLLDGAGICLELVCPDKPPQEGAPGPQVGGHDRLGWLTLDLETDDLSALDAHLRAQGADILWSMRRMSTSRASTLIRDPEGNNVAIFGPVPA